MNDGYFQRRTCHAHFLLFVFSEVKSFRYDSAVFPIYRELQSPTKAKMRVVVTSSVYVVGFCYILFSCAAYTLFGDATSTDILQNFDRDISKIIRNVVILTSAVRLGYVVTLVLTFPLIVFAVRNILDAVIFGDTDRFQHLRFTVLTCCILGFTVFGSIMVPNIWIAFQFTGSTAAVIIGFILPGLVALKTDGAVTRVSHNRSAWSLLAVGATVSVLGVSTNIWGMYQSRE